MSREWEVIKTLSVRALLKWTDRLSHRKSQLISPLAPTVVFLRTLNSSQWTSPFYTYNFLSNKWFKREKYFLYMFFLEIFYHFPCTRWFSHIFLQRSLAHIWQLPKTSFHRTLCQAGRCSALGWWRTLVRGWSWPLQWQGPHPTWVSTTTQAQALKSRPSRGKQDYQEISYLKWWIGAILIILNPVIYPAVIRFLLYDY